LLNTTEVQCIYSLEPSQWQELSDAPSTLHNYEGSKEWNGSATVLAQNWSDGVTRAKVLGQGGHATRRKWDPRKQLTVTLHFDTPTEVSHVFHRYKIRREKHRSEVGWSVIAQMLQHPKVNISYRKHSKIFVKMNLRMTLQNVYSCDMYLLDRGMIHRLLIETVFKLWFIEYWAKLTAMLSSYVK
jgi:hypothetical protein